MIVTGLITRFISAHLGAKIVKRVIVLLPNCLFFNRQIKKLLKMSKIIKSSINNFG